MAVFVIDTREFYFSQFYFLNIWPPYLYVSASTIFAAGIIFLYARSAWGWPVGAVGLMMLIHGHASFIGLVPIIALCSVVPLGFLSFQSAGLGRELIVYLKENRYFIAGALFVVLLFFTPIIINTILNWPGEIPKYFQFAEKGSTHSLVELGVFWRRFLDYGLFVVLLAPVFSLGRQGSGFFPLFFALILSFAPAAIFYSFRGLDTLSYKYPLFWIAPMIGATFALAIFMIFYSIVRPAWRVLLIVSCLIFSIYGLTFYQSSKNFESVQAEKFNAALVQLREGVSKTGLVELYVRKDQIQPIVYSLVLFSIDKRTNGRGLCVNKDSYDVAYTDFYICRADDNVERRVDVVQLGNHAVTGAIARIDETVFLKR